jgi:hypothetical protein
MNHEDIVNLAKKSGFSDKDIESLMYIVKTVAAAEREACIKLIEKDDSMRWSGAADVIRYRGQQLK